MKKWQKGDSFIMNNWKITTKILS